MDSEKWLKATKLSPKFDKLFGFSMKPYLNPFLGLDIIALDMKFRELNPEYDPDKCTYKKMKNIGMSEFVRIRYGIEAVELIEELLKI